MPVKCLITVKEKEQNAPFSVCCFGVFDDNV